jgi:hypothetical protein
MRTGTSLADILFLEIAVGNIVVAPIGHRVKLQAVRELHLVGFAKLLKLLAPFAVSFALGRYGGLLLALGKVVKLDGVLVGVATGEGEWVQGCCGGWARWGPTVSSVVRCDCGRQRKTQRMGIGGSSGSGLRRRPAGVPSPPSLRLSAVH